MFTKEVKKGTTNPNTGAVGPHPIERAITAKHCVAGLDFCEEHADGSYTLTFPSAEHYSDFLDELASSSQDRVVIADVLRRHAA
jgi:hypothetical protein